MNGKEILHIQKNIDERHTFYFHDITKLLDFMSYNTSKLSAEDVREKFLIIRYILNLPELYHFEDFNVLQAQVFESTVNNFNTPNNSRLMEWLIPILSEKPSLSQLNIIIDGYIGEYIRYTREFDLVPTVIDELIRYCSSPGRPFTQNEATQVSELLNGFIYLFYDIPEHLYKPQ